MNKFIQKIKEIANRNKKVAIFVDMDGTIAVYNVYPEDKVMEKMGEEYSLLEPIDYVLNILKEINRNNNISIEEFRKETSKILNDSFYGNISLEDTWEKMFKIVKVTDNNIK